MDWINVSTQAEFDAQVKLGNGCIVVSGSFVARESSHVVAWGSSHVVAWGSSHVEARESSHVVAWGSSHVVAWESSHVVAWESSHVVAWESSHVVAWGSSHVVAWGSSHVVAWESSHVEARESSHVEARGAVFVRLFSALKIVASAQVVILIHGKCQSISGGIQIKHKLPTTAKAWCEYWGIKVKAGIATIFKGVNDNFRAEHNSFPYTPNTIPKAIDWDGGKNECGGGLHFSPTPCMTKDFNNKATKFIACPVRLKDMRAPKLTDEYPQKIKASKCCGKVYEVDINGKRLGGKKK